MIITVLTGTVQIIRTAIFTKNTHNKKNRVYTRFFSYINLLFLVVGNDLLGDVYRSVFCLNIISCQVLTDNTDCKELYSADKGDKYYKLSKAVHVYVAYKFSNDSNYGIYYAEQRCQRA